MKRAWIFIVWLFLLSWLFVPVRSSFAVSCTALRCGTRLVSQGDSRAEVVHKCGEPDDVEAWQEERIMRDFSYPVFRDRRRRYPVYREPFLVEEHVRIEEWTYNFGSTRFIRILRFENGILTDIFLGDYGY